MNEARVGSASRHASVRDRSRARAYVHHKLVGNFLGRELAAFTQDARGTQPGFSPVRLMISLQTSMRRHLPALPGFLLALSSRSQRWKVAGETMVMRS
jgi:hypothetical protein